MTRWIETRERLPEQPGVYTVVRRKRGTNVQDECYWTGETWKVGGQEVHGIICWREDAQG